MDELTTGYDVVRYASEVHISGGTYMILITGGLGYIGTHLAASLISEGHEVVLVDNLTNSRLQMLAHIEQLTGVFVRFIRQDVRNTPALQRIFEQYGVTAVVHLANLHNAAEAVSQPLAYYNNNVAGLLSVMRAMQRTGVNKLLFASSVCVYGECNEPATETTPMQPKYAYAKSLQIAQTILADTFAVHDDWQIAIMRYANIVAGHASYQLGEITHGLVTTLFPKLALVADKVQPELEIYATHHNAANSSGEDSSCMRDYVHMQDVTEANMQALAWLHNLPQGVCEIFNIGMGNSHSVHEIIEQYENTTAQTIATQVLPQRMGDLSCSQIDISKAKTVLKWQPKKTLADMCVDSWRFYHTYQQKNRRV